MRYEQIDGAISRSLRKEIRIALILCLGLVGGLGGVAATAQISGAVIGLGTLIAEGRSRQVQHPDGGIVGEILVREGDLASAGAVLFRLDGTLAQASLGIIDSQLDQLTAQEARLLAEQARTEVIAFPTDLREDEGDRAQLLITGQTALMRARKLTMDGRKAQLTEQVRQFGEQAAALAAQRQAVEENTALLDEQIEDVTRLHELGLVIDSQLTNLRRERASLIGSRAALAAEIAEVRQAVTVTELQKVQVDEEFDQGVLTELDQKRTEIARLREERIAALDRLNRLEIRAPLTGRLHELGVHTIGGVVAPGETLVRVVPADDRLIVEVKLRPIDVDQVRRAQGARVRMTGLDQRVTPPLAAKVIDVAADLTSDPQTGTTYYLTKLEISDAALAEVGAETLRPGMPVEVFIETTPRSILFYLVQPIADQMRHALRER